MKDLVASCGCVQRTGTIVAAGCGDAVQAVRALDHSCRSNAVVTECGKSVQHLYAAIAELIERAAAPPARHGRASIDIAGVVHDDAPSRIGPVAAAGEVIQESFHPIAKRSGQDVSGRRQAEEHTPIQTPTDRCAVEPPIGAEHKGTVGLMPFGPSNEYNRRYVQPEPWGVSLNTEPPTGPPLLVVP